MQVVTDDKHYINIAETIRERTGTETTYTSEEMPAGVNEVYKAGGNAVLAKLVNNGGRKDFYQLCHAAGDLSDFTFPEGTKPTYTEEMFNNYTGKYLPAGLDFSNVYAKNTSARGYRSVYSLFYMCRNLIEIYDLKIPVQYNYSNTFANDNKLTKIGFTIIADETTTFTSTFYGCSELVYVRFGGVIGTSIDISSCKALEAESTKSLLTTLKDFSGTTSEYTKTVTIKQVAFSKLEEEGATAEWTDAEGNTSLITWPEYIDNKKWNLTLKR